VWRSEDCDHKDDSFYKRRRCRKSLRYFVAGVNGERGKQKVVSAKTRTWAIAEEAKRKLEDKFREADPTKPIEAVTVKTESRPSLEQAVTLFVMDKRSQGLDEDVLKKYKRELNRFSDFIGRRSRACDYPWRNPFAVL
jgi:hypothetical protein